MDTKSCDSQKCDTQDWDTQTCDNVTSPPTDNAMGEIERGDKLQESEALKTTGHCSCTFE